MPETETTSQRGLTRSRAVLDRVRQLPDLARSLLRATAFWLAVVLPVVYLPLLVVTPAQSISLVSTLLVVHILAVFVGAGHEP